MEAGLEVSHMLKPRQMSHSLPVVAKLESKLFLQSHVCGMLPCHTMTTVD